MAFPASVFSDPAFHTDPYGVYGQIRAESPAYQTKLPNGTEVYLVSRSDDVEACLKDSRFVKNIHNARQRAPGLMARLGFTRYFSNANMLRADPPEHTRLRALVHQSFTPKLVATMREHVQAIADELIDKVEPVGQMDLIHSFAFPLPVTVICELLGVPQTDVPKFQRWSGALISSGVLSSESVPLVPEFLLLVRYMRSLVRKRRKSDTPGEDLLGQLLQAREDDDQLTERELISTLILLLIAGHETTVNLIGNGMLALLLHRDQLERLQQDPALEVSSEIEQFQGVHR